MVMIMMMMMMMMMMLIQMFVAMMAGEQVDGRRASTKQGMFARAAGEARMAYTQACRFVEDKLCF